MGTAKSPSQYASAGADFKHNFIDPTIEDSEGSLVYASLATLYADFHKGGSLDAQPYATGNHLQQASYGNYAFGVFFAAAGVPLNQTLTAASTYGYWQQIWGAYKTQTLSPDYGGIPVANVQNIISGYNDQLNGTTCQ